MEIENQMNQMVAQAAVVRGRTDKIQELRIRRASASPCKNKNGIRGTTTSPTTTPPTPTSPTSCSPNPNPNNNNKNIRNNNNNNNNNNSNRCFSNLDNKSTITSKVDDILNA